MNSSWWLLWLTILLFRGRWCSGQTHATVIYASINSKLQHPPWASPGIWTFKDWFIYIIFAILAERNVFFRFLCDIYWNYSPLGKKATTIHLPLWWIAVNILQSSAAFRVNYYWPTEKLNFTYKIDGRSNKLTVLFKNTVSHHKMRLLRKSRTAQAGDSTWHGQFIWTFQYLKTLKSVRTR